MSSKTVWSGRFGHAVAQLRTTAVLFGGYSIGSLSDAWSSSSPYSRWRLMCNVSGAFPRYYHALLVSKGLILVAGKYKRDMI